MKTTLDIQHKGNIGDEGMVRMTFDENSIAHLMTVLTDMYSDPELAVIREYSTNGWDAHRAAGNPAPIEVTLPTPLNPTFIVKDYGTGMSLETINDVLTKYGRSTKRETDEQTGMLGLGFKAGLAYTSQFTVISTFEGKQSLVLVTRLEDGGAAIQVLEHEATEDPNGTEVHVPVSDVHSFTRACNVFFLYWEPGSVLVNGEPPASIFNPDYGGSLIDPDICIFAASNGQVDHDYVVMGNVRYRVSQKHPIGREVHRSRYAQNGSFNVVARVPIGSVNFTPNREALNYTKRTLETLATIREFAHSRFQAEIQAQLDAAETRKDAYFLHESLHRMTDKLLTYRGERIPSFINLVNLPELEEDDESEFPFPWVLLWNDSARRLKSQGITMQEAMTGARLFVTGFTGRSMHEGLKYRIKKWMEDNMPEPPSMGRNVGHVYIIPGDLREPWCEHIPQVTIETIRAVVIPKKDQPKRSRAGVYRYLFDNGQKVRTEHELPEGKTQVFYISSSMDRGRDQLERLASAFGGVCAVVNKGSENAFARRYPDVPELWDFLIPTMGVVASSISPISAYIYTTDGSGDLHMMAEFDREGIMDPEFAALAALSKAALHDEGQAKLRNLFGRIKSVCDVVYRVKEDGRSEWIKPPELARGDYRARVRKIIGQYPLIAAAGDYYRLPGDRTGRDVSVTMKVEYVNSLWAARNQLNLLPATYG